MKAFMPYFNMQQSCCLLFFFHFPFMNNTRLREDRISDYRDPRSISKSGGHFIVLLCDSFLQQKKKKKVFGHTFVHAQNIKIFTYTLYILISHKQSHTSHDQEQNTLA